MRVGVILGVLLIALGTWIVSGKAAYRSTKADVDIGPLQATVQEKETVPRWIGAVAIGAGVLVLVATRRKA